MKPSEKAWVVLFGGAGREETIAALRSAGVTVATVLVPLKASPKLETAIQRLRDAGFHVVAAARGEVDSVLRTVDAQVALSIGFPYLLGESVIRRYDLALNIHPTLLPKYRGPTTAPYILINSETEAGSTVHLLEAEMDAGDIVCQSRVPLSKFDTVRSVQRKVYATESALIVEALRRLDAGSPNAKQDVAQATSYPKKRTPADSEIDPTRSLVELFDTIRACDPVEFPAFFFVDGQKVCVRLWRPDKPPGEEDMI